MPGCHSIPAQLRRAAGVARPVVMAASLGLLLAVGSHAFAQFTITDINPNQSTLDPSDPDGASGGRVNGLASVAGDNQIFYAASEWGGLYKSTDAGRTWVRLDRHLPVVTWGVEVDPANRDRVYATSFYDGRVSSLAGINVSTDGGATWTHPATATPPAAFNCAAARRTEPSAFGIGIDPDQPRHVYIGTNCGLAISNDSGVTWRFVDPTPDDPANDVWDVVVHARGTVDICGDDGHFRSTDGGATWTTGVGLPSGRCSIAASPHESRVLFVTVGNNVYESDDGGATWTNLGTPDSARQGRIPFVATNRRSAAAEGNAFDLWYGDVRLFRGTCTSNPPGGGLRCPMGTVGPIPSPPPPTPAGWAGPFTRSAGGHDDVGDVAFDTRATADACPVLFSSDGGVYFNTKPASPDCHTPLWEQPDITPHALWLFGMAGANQAGNANEDLYFGNQDTGTFATTDAGAANPTWNNRQCCDGFDDSADPSRILYTVCCFSPPPANRLFLRNPGMTGGSEINTYPPGNLPGFRPIDIIAQFGSDDYTVVTTSGVFITQNINASPIVWTQLGAATSPAGACGIRAAVAGGTPSFYVQAGSCSGRTADQLWRFVGTNPAGAWQPVSPPSGGIGIYAVHPNDPNRLYASNLTAAGPQMISSSDGGTTWQNDAQLDNLMTGGGVFKYQTQRGPTNFTGFGGYPQPSLVAFDPDDPDILVAGGLDSGVFLSTDGGGSWTLVTDPFDAGNSGTPHLPRPWFAYFDHEPSDVVNVYIGTQGRGVWRVSFRPPQPKFEYAAKLVCGVQSDPKAMRLAKGFYATAINIHNPQEAPVKFFKKLALTFPPEEQRPGKVMPISEDKLGPDEALEVDCIDIQRRLFPQGFPTPYIKGFVVIRSTHSLDVTAVYTAASLDKDPCCEQKVGQHTSVDVEQIRERQIERARELPDLIPVPDASGLFCRLRDGKLIVTVRNQGAGPAGPSQTEVDFFRFGKFTQPTPALAPGASTDLLFDLPPNCFVPDCRFRITVDVMGAVPETDEGNNVAEDACIG